MIFVTKLHLNVLYWEVTLTQTYLGILPRQEFSDYLLIMNKCFYVLMPNVLIYLIHTAQRASQQNFMVTQNLRESIIKYESVFINSDFSDHIPLCLELQIDFSCHKTSARKCKTNVTRHKCTEIHSETYKRELDKSISCIAFFYDAVSCVDYQCNMHTGFSVICIIVALLPEICACQRC